ncbi:MAG: hypothetical protein ABIO55_02960 [Ginsengibacter sp.]
MSSYFNLAPIVLFVYNRPWHTQQTLEALSKNDLANESLLYIFSDAAKENADAKAIKKIAETRECIKKRQWCREVIIIERETNLGLANSIIKGVTEIVNKHGNLIVLEDDLITSAYFLQFMNEALKTYETEKKVIQIGACNFFATSKSIPETFFVHLPDCWGWATWQDRWTLFENDAELLMKKLKNDTVRMLRFNCFGAYNFESMLQDQLNRRVDSWAIRWQAVCVLNDKLILYPNPALTNHIGSKEGTHQSFAISPRLATKPVKVEKQQVKESEKITRLLKLGYQQNNYIKPTFKKRVRIKLHTIINKFK